MLRLTIASVLLIALGCGKKADSRPAIVPSQVKPVAAQWWLAPDQHCPAGTSLMGQPAPGGHGVWCADDQMVRTGPRTNFHPNGVKASEGWEVEDEWVGPWTFWHDNGKLAREEIRLPGDGLTGRYRQWDRRGRLLGELELPGGTGHITIWNEGGTIAQEGEMKAGRREGTWRVFDERGTLDSESTYRGGVVEGPSTMFGDDGGKLAFGQYRAGEMDGRWTYLVGGEIDRVDVYQAGERTRTFYYQHGTRLGIEPAPTACDTKSGLESALSTRDLERCVERAPAFPGLVLVGDFAHDRGCRLMTMFVDCVRRDDGVPAREVLERAGWSQADPAHRGAIALRYLQQVATVFGNHLASDPESPQVAPSPDGSVVIVAWADHPSGMTPGRRADKVEYRFTAAGDLSSKVTDSIDEQR